MTARLNRAILLLLSIFILLVLLTSCSEESGESNPIDTGSNNPVNPGTTGSVKINDYLPKKPYWGDVIEIFGEGFPTNVNDVSVFFPGNKISIKDSLPEGSGLYTCRGTVLEISPTKMKVKVPYNTFLNTLGQPAPSAANNGYGGIAVKVKGKKFYQTSNDFIYYKARPYINVHGIKPVGTLGVQIQPGEKFIIEGKGFGLTPTEGKLTVNGVNVPVDSVW